jgi:enoyl-CoA hydratase/carnithine racemase
MPMAGPDEEPRLTVEQDGPVLLMGLNRAAKRNAFDQAMVEALSAAYTRLETDTDLRCGLLFGHGTDFTAGLDLPYFAGQWAAGNNPFEPVAGNVDPLGLAGPPRRTPVVCAVQGRCYTLGIELMLAADVRVAALDASFVQAEVLRGIFPVGGATIRFVNQAGWGNAMRWMLTGDAFGAGEAHRIGLVQEVTPPGEQLDAALAIARRIAAAAPLGVSATIGSARLALERGPDVAAQRMLPDLRVLLESEDAGEAIAAFLERRPAVFHGR